MADGGFRVSKRQQVGLAFAAVALTAMAVVAEYALITSGRFDHVLGHFTWAAWVVGPPLWFLWEWSRQDGMKPDELQEFKYSQELASKLWIAVATILTILKVTGGSD